MDLNKYEKIDPKQAIILLIHGHEVFSQTGGLYKLDKETNELWLTFGELSGTTSLSVSEALRTDWYSKKPFNVRQEMKDRPDEWIGAFCRGGERWYKVGFDSEAFCAVHTALHNDIKNPNITWHAVNPIDAEVLDECIPIDDVPEIFK